MRGPESIPAPARAGSCEERAAALRTERRGRLRAGMARPEMGRTVPPAASASLR